MLPILDDHAHLSPSGKRSEAVRQFEKAGGTHLIVSHMPYRLNPILSRGDWRAEFEITCSLVDEARKETGVQVFCVVGPYPVELLDISERIGADKALQLMKEGVEVAAELVLEKKAIGIGEVGRPHFEAAPEIMRMSNEIMRYCMEKAKDADCPVVIHSEHVTSSNLEELSHMAQEAGLRAERVVKHYYGKIGRDWPTGGLSLSVLSTRDNILSAIENKLSFMMETDYLDDLSRPGAVLAPQTVPKRTKQLFEEGIIDERLWRKIHIERPKIAYGIDMEI